MIYAELAGGLGNQLFIYAFARALSLSTGEPAALLDRQDWKTGAPAHTAVALRDFCISPEVEILPGEGFAKAHLPAQNALKALMIKREQRGGMLSRDWHGFEAAAAPFLNRCGVHFATDGFIPCHRYAHPADFLAWGYFQSEEYFAPHAETLRRELCPRPTLLGSGADETTRALAAQIAAAEMPVCLHARRGDYQSAANKIFNVCTPAYYAAAAKAVAARWPRATLFVFSDDLSWAKANLNTAGLPAVFAEGPRAPAAELALMAGCRQFIISNSTFSWWAQWLAQRPGEAAPGVWAPSRWYTIDKTCGLYREGWELVEG